MTALAIMGLLPPGAARRRRDRCSTARDLLARSASAEMCAVRGRDVGMVFQEPMTALNPLQTIGDQVAETVRVHGAAGRAEARAIAARDARPRRPAAGALPARPLPARALRRPAPARRHRHGDRAAPEAADRRRADDRARRHHPGGDPRAAAPAGRRGRHGADADHPRPRRGRRPRRPRRDHAATARSSRPAPTARGAARDAPPLHPRALRGLGAPPGARRPAGRARRCSRSRAWSATTGSPRRLFRPPGRFAPSTASASPSTRGESVGLVGESGCGKSTLARAILGARGAAGRRASGSTARRSRAGERMPRSLRAKMQVVFQDPYGSFNPRHRVERLVAEPFHLLDDAAGRRRPPRRGRGGADRGRPRARGRATSTSTSSPAASASASPSPAR